MRGWGSIDAWGRLIARISWNYVDPPPGGGYVVSAATIRGIGKALRPGGRFLLETLHRDGLPARFRSRIAEKTSNGTIVLHEYVWDLARDVIDDRVTLIRPDGTRTEYTTSLRMRFLHQLLALMRRAGLEPLVWYGGLDGSPLHLGSRRLALISTRRP
jgi:SAM-dependent methyltransferase